MYLAGCDETTKDSVQYTGDLVAEALTQVVTTREGAIAGGALITMSVGMPAVGSLLTPVMAPNSRTYWAGVAISGLCSTVAGAVARRYSPY